ncbi:hypothetical protein [Streptomyces sp. NBRC 110465]|uniref:hypothetical protein n=1 Tax=Streptomyces sp. NBRC 110465 TaxID=1897621 RepID=UPI001161028B|nr:hypothetical protein [Streptomyces sp. NBRC 110465]
MTDRDRPSPRPRSAPETPDPAVPKGAQPSRDEVPPPPPVRRRRGPAPTIQLNTRVAPEVDELVAHVCDVRGWSKREAVEFALKRTYARELREIEAARENAS